MDETTSLPQTAAETTGEAPTETVRRVDEESEQTPAAESAREDIAVEPGQTPAQDNQSVLDEILTGDSPQPEDEEDADAQKIALLEAIVYITDEPLAPQQIAQALGEPLEKVKQLLERLTAEYNRPSHGLIVREVAGGYKMATKPEHHESVRAFVKNLNPPLKLSLAALETLAVIAYKQPITAPEIMEIRGVQGAGVLKTLVDRKLITTAGRKNVVGRPILYKTTRDFLVQFGLKDLTELPTLKEFEELRRLAFDEPSMTPQMPEETAAEARPDAPPDEPATQSEPEAAPEAEVPAKTGDA